jgi:hypothetical protein
VTLAVLNSEPVPASNHVSIARSENGYRLRFLGEAGRDYQILRSPDLSLWNILTNLPASPTGLIDYEDVDPLVPTGFYRIARP